tara:strand:+ start:1313 stop:1726 length:414 start_codon:yes stop_codon:yes gene_type:complete
MNKSNITNDYMDTQELGESFAKKIKQGDIILLYGDLGAGKTTFVKGILKGFNFTGEVTSPTFSLINEYEADRMIIHIDCYRETEIRRWINIGIEDYFNSSDIVIIEWPEILEDIIPDHAIKVKINHIDDNKREIVFL